MRRIAFLALVLWPGVALAQQGPRLIAPPDAPPPAAGPRLVAPPDPRPAPLVAPGAPVQPLVAPASAAPVPPQPPARAAPPAVFESRELWDGAIEISPMWFTAEVARDRIAAGRRYRNHVLQFEATLDRREILSTCGGSTQSGTGASNCNVLSDDPAHRYYGGRSLILTVRVPGVGQGNFECMIADDPIASVLSDNLRVGQPAWVAGTLIRIGLSFELADCYVLTGHPDPEGLRAWAAGEAERLRNRARLERQ